MRHSFDILGINIINLHQFPLFHPFSLCIPRMFGIHPATSPAQLGPVLLNPQMRSFRQTSALATQGHRGCAGFGLNPRSLGEVHQQIWKKWKILHKQFVFMPKYRLDLTPNGMFGIVSILTSDFTNRNGRLCQKKHGFYQQNADVVNIRTPYICQGRC